MAHPSETSERIRTWLTEEALPLWATAGLDRDRGGFHEVLSLAGEPDLDRAKRLRVQCRQIYVYAHAHVLGLHSDAERVAGEGVSFVESKGWHSQRGGWIHFFAPDGGVQDDKADTYDHAFAVLAFAWLCRAGFADKGRPLLDKTFSFMEAQLMHEGQGWREALPHRLPRWQNPHMHCFEAFMAGFEGTGDTRFLDHGTRIFQLFTDYFFDAEKGALLEYFEENLAPVKDVSKQRIEPGHQMEWVWLLREYERLTGEDVSLYADRLYETGHTHGYNSQLELLIDELDAELRPTKSTLRCWPQTEYLKATLAQFVASRDDALLARSQDIVDRIFDLYLSGAVKGGWRDQFDSDGNNLSTDMPASTFYHLFCAFAYAMKVYDAA